jgi:hypothetical protein
MLISIFPESLVGPASGIEESPGSDISPGHLTGGARPSLPGLVSGPVTWGEEARRDNLRVREASRSQAVQVLFIRAGRLSTDVVILRLSSLICTLRGVCARVCDARISNGCGTGLGCDRAKAQPTSRFMAFPCFHIL